MGARHEVIRPETPHWGSPPGHCRWCGEAVTREDGTPNTRRRWHDPCLDEYRFRAWPDEARRVVFRRDHAVCAACGVDCLGEGLPWAADHIVPLADGGPHELENLQTLCGSCHRDKTSREARERAARRREGGTDAGQLSLLGGAA
jgi:5-methylcytosine-specific restriction endonuclease McrA